MLPDAPDETALKAWHLKQLRWSLQALASSEAAQPALFPEVPHTPQDLAYQFQHWSAVVCANYDEELDAAQRESLAALERKLRRMSRDGEDFDLDLWTDAARRTHDHWKDVRGLAIAALDAFAWE
jgi:hypothetical protein